MGTTSAAPGENKGRRDFVKLILCAVSFLLLSGNTRASSISCVLSVVCIFHLKEGSLWSVKNWKWMILSMISFFSSLCAWSFGDEIVDEEKAYSLKLFLWWMSTSMQTIWGLILSMFLYSAFKSGNILTTIPDEYFFLRNNI